MPNQPRKLTYRPSAAPTNPEPTDQVEKPGLLRRGAAAVTRIGSGAIGGTLSAEPGLGTALGGAIGGGGEWLAQAIEEGHRPTMDRGHLARIGAASALTAIPGAWWIKSGKVLASAGRSALISGAGEAGREIAAGEDLNPTSIALSGGIGGLTGGVIGRWTRPSTVKMPPGPTEPSQTLDDFIKAGNWKPDEVERQAARYEAMGEPLSARAIRDAAIRQDKGTTALYTHVARENNPVAVEKAHEAANALVAKERIAGEKAFNANATAEQKAAEEATKLATIQKAREKMGVAPKAPVFTKTVSATNEAGAKESMATKFGKPKKGKGTAPTAATEPVAEPLTPAAAPETAPAVVPEAPQSKAAQGAAAVQAEIDAAKATATAPTTVEQELLAKLGGTKETPEPRDIIAQQERRVAPQVPMAGGKRAGDVALDSRITSIAPEVPPAAAAPVAPIIAKAVEPAAAPVVAAAEPTIAQQAAALPANPPLPEGMAAWARFFRNPRQAQYAHDAMANVPEDAQQALNNLWAQADVAKGAGRRLMGAKIQGVRKSMGLPAPPKPTAVAEAAPAAVPAVEEAALPAIAGTPSNETLAQQNELMKTLLSRKEGTRLSADDIEQLQKTGINQFGWGATKPIAPTGTPGARFPDELPTEAAGAVAPAVEAQAAPEVPAAAPAKVKGTRGKKAAAPIAATPATRSLAEIEADIAAVKAMEQSSQAPVRTAEDIAAAQTTPNPGLAPAGKPRLVKTKAPVAVPETAAERLKGEKGAINPAMSVRLGLGAAGALVGAAVTPDDPIAGAVLGGAVGMSAPTLVRSLASIGVNPRLGQIGEKLKTPEGAMEVASDVGHLLPHIQRFNMLMSSAGLPANVIAGPWGSGFFGTLTKALAGDQRAVAGLKLMINPKIVGNAMWKARDRAAELMARAEAGDPLLRSELGGPALEKLPPGTRQFLQLPGRAMTAGDLGIRELLKSVGFSEAEAREITLTSEPFLPLTKKLADLNRGTSSPMLQLLFPFVKTPANILEQGLLGVPIVGSITNRARVAHGAPDMPGTEQMWRQIIGTLVGFAGYAAGLTLPPDQARTASRYITNAAGQYSLLAGIGFAAGQSQQAGQPIMSRRTVNEMKSAIPLPAADNLANATNWLVGNGGRMPNGIVPGLARDIYNMTSPAPTIKPVKPLRYKPSK